MARRQEDDRVRRSSRDVSMALQRYQLHGVRETGEELGRGSYATVLKVEYHGISCAAKKIYSVLGQPGEGDRIVARFEEECHLLGTLRHPNIVQFMGIFRDRESDLPVLVMEFLPATLEQCVERYGRLPTEICYAILRDVALGLRYLHEQRPRVIHRDLSANNILLTGDMAAKIADLGVAKIISAERNHMTQTPGTQSYMPPEALRPNPRYDVEVDVFSFGVMLVHVLSGQWPLPSEATVVHPRNPARVIGVSEVERRAEYLNIIGRPSHGQEGHPLMPLIERCLCNSPKLRPIASELVERMNDAVTRHPLTFNNRVDMMQRINSIQRDKESLQTQVSMLEGQVERGEVAQREQRELREQRKQQETALKVGIHQLQLQLGKFIAKVKLRDDKIASIQRERDALQTRVSILEGQVERGEVARAQLRERKQLRETALTVKIKQLQLQVSHLDAEKTHTSAIASARAELYHSEMQAKNRQHQEELKGQQKRYMAEIAAKETQFQTELSKLQDQLNTKERQLQAQIDKDGGDQLLLKTTELLSQRSLLSQQRSTIEGLYSQLEQATQCLTSGTQVHAFSPDTSLVWRECTSIPLKMLAANATSINGKVYMGGSVPFDDDCDICYGVCKYDPVKNEWKTLPHAPVQAFGVGQLNGKLVIMGGVSEGEGITGDVYVFEEDTQQWVKSIPPMPTGLFSVKVAHHGSALVVCGVPDESSPASLFVYNSQSSQWHSRAPPPLPFNSVCSYGAIINDKYYLAIGAGNFESERLPSSPAVFSLPLSTLLNPNAPLELSSWQRMPDTPCHTSYLVANGGCLLALGGLTKACNLKNYDDTNLSTAAYAYCPATSSWVKIGDLPDLQIFSAITTLPSGELFIAGGEGPAGGHNKVFTGVYRVHF